MPWQGSNFARRSLNGSALDIMEMLTLIKEPEIRLLSNLGALRKD